MTEPFLGEIKVVSFNFPPKGWALCDGQLLPIDQNQALFSILGTTYGGDGQRTFGLPNLQGRVPLHVGGGFSIGQFAGEEVHTLLVSELPTHTHTVSAISSSATLASPMGARFAAASTTNFASPGGAASLLDANVIGANGSSQPHDNMSPYLVLVFVIALQGIFPSQN
jgi:microcystin-dependent protein